MSLCRLQIGLAGFEVALDKSVAGGCRQIEIQDLEYEPLHADNLDLGVCVIGDVGEVGYLWWEDLLKLGSYVHGSCAHKL